MKHGLCVIGYGGMGSWHTRRADGSDAVDLIGIYDIAEDKRVKAEDNGIYAFGSLEEVLSDKRVDLVTVAIPNDSHEEVAIKCMAAGKNVISEKPVTLSVASLERMIEASKKYGVKFSVHQNRRWDVDFIAVRDLKENGAIGEVFDIESRIHGSRGIPSDWRCEKKHGGGMLYDWGVHLIDQILMIWKDEKLTSVSCRFDNITTKEVDDGFRLELLFANGARAYIEVETYNFIQMPRFFVRGKKGSAMITDWREPCKVVECFAWHENDVLPVPTAAGLTKTMAPRDDITTKTYTVEIPKSDVHDYYRNFCKAIEGKEEQIVTHAQMLRVMKVIEASFESVKKGTPIVVDL